MPAATDTTDAVSASRWPAAALALGSGALVALSLPPWGFWPLALVGVAVFAFATDRVSTRSQRALVGFAFGLGWMSLGMGWMIQLTAPGYVVAALVFAGFHAAAAAAAPTGQWRLFGRASAHALVEALRFSFPFGGVPLATLGMSQVGGPLVGIVRVGGVITLTFVVFVIGIAVGTALASRSDFDRGALGAAFATVAVLVIASLVAPQGNPTGDELRIAIVQGGGEQGTTALDVPSRVVTERHLAATATIEPDPELDFVLWPENTIDATDFATSPLAEAVTEQAARLGVPIAVGLTETVAGQGARRYTNAHVVVTPDGELSSRYDKVRRVPFGEYVPLRSLLELVTSEVNRVGNAVPGETPAVLDLPSGERFAVVISWEVFFGGRAREGVKVDGSMILNPTNGASYTGTIVQTQQVASSRLRAIETGRWVGQAAPTGFSAFVDEAGTVVQRTSQREQAVLFQDVPQRDGRTWYVSLGDGPVIVALLAIFAGATVISRRRRPDAAPDVTPQPAA